MSSTKIDATALTNFLKTCKGFDKVIDKVKILSVGEGRCSVELTIDEGLLNALGGLHGGASATLIDSISTFALVSLGGVPGVSVDLHLSYLKPAKLGDEIIVEGIVLKTGKTLAFLEGLIKHKESGDVLVKGSHTKFIAQ